MMKWRRKVMQQKSYYDRKSGENKEIHKYINEEMAEQRKEGIKDKTHINI